MFIKIILIVALLEFSLNKEYNAVTLPMEKNSKYGDDVCKYTDEEQDYVKSCEKGKFCHDQSTIDTLDYSRGKVREKGSEIEICQDLPKVLPLYAYNEEGCSNDFECVEGYKCIEKVCSYECGSGEFYYGENVGGSSFGCKPNADKGTDGICYEFTKYSNSAPTYKYTSPKTNKICGKITLIDEPTDNKRYYVNKYEYVFKGEVEDGDYVTDAKLCKSGFALYFYKDGKTKDPDTPGSNSMHLRCVTPISIYSNNVDDDEQNPSPNFSECLINYKIKEDGEILRYNLRNIQNLPTSDGIIINYCSYSNRNYIKLQSEKYREFYTKISEEERKTCGDLDYANQYTCENNELIKLWYIYKEPKDYLIYNNRKKLEKVLDYKIQKKYPCYSLSQFLSIKFIYLLFLLLF